MNDFELYINLIEQTKNKKKPENISGCISGSILAALMF